MLNKYHNQGFRSHLTQYQVRLEMSKKKVAEELEEICFHEDKPCWQAGPVTSTLNVSAQ